jgi:hypothetical protein
MALGAFDTPESRRALDAGTRDKVLAPYCLAALYRLTKDPKHLEALEKVVGPEAGFTTFIVGNYLLEKVNTDQAKKLADRWKEQRDAAEARAKQNGGTKSTKEPGAQSAG